MVAVLPLVLALLAALWQLAVWLLPGGETGSNTVYNLLTVLLTAGLLFFGYRLYMENRATIFGLGDNQRALLYGSVAVATVALLATNRLWNNGGLGALVWFALLSLAGWGIYRVWRAYSEY